jgi:hypothetical protein
MQVLYAGAPQRGYHTGGIQAETPCTERERGLRSYERAVQAHGCSGAG